MARFKKFKKNAVSNLLKHCNREFRNYSNKGINTDLSYRNYSLLPERGVSDYEYFLSLIKNPNISYWNREDTVAMIGIVISYPFINDEESEVREFFSVCVDFLNQRFGGKNAVQAIVHLDESQDNARHKGKPHLHYNFVPIIPNENKRRKTEYQVCCSKVLTPLQFKTFHPDLQQYLLEHGINEYTVSRVFYGAVRNHDGRNFYVNQIKSGQMDRYLRTKER